MFSVTSMARIFLLLATFFVLPTPSEASSCLNSSVGHDCVHGLAGVQGHLANSIRPSVLSEQAVASDSLAFCRGEPIEMFASHSSCHRWRLVLAWAFSSDSLITPVNDAIGQLLSSQKFRYPFDQPQVMPEHFYPQPREVRGDPVSRMPQPVLRHSGLNSEGFHRGSTVWFGL